MITPQELNTAIRDWQLTKISRNDNTVTDNAIAVATAEIQAYLSGRYDISTPEFASHPLLKEYCKDIALWTLIKLCNADIVYEHIKERYLRAIDFLKDVSKGTITLNLPSHTTPDGSPNGRLKLNSNPKFNHNY